VAPSATLFLFFVAVAFHMSSHPILGDKLPGFKGSFTGVRSQVSDPFIRLHL